MAGGILDYVVSSEPCQVDIPVCQLAFSWLLAIRLSRAACVHRIAGCQASHWLFVGIYVFLIGQALSRFLSHEDDEPPGLARLLTRIPSMVSKTRLCLMGVLPFARLSCILAHSIGMVDLVHPILGYQVVLLSSKRSSVVLQQGRVEQANARNRQSSLVPALQAHGALL